MEFKAALKYARVGVQRARKVADLVRGQKVEEADRRLTFDHSKSSGLFQKLLHSAVAQAQEGSEDRLYVKAVYVNQGPHLKRSRPAARSQIARRNKKQSHLHIILSEKR